MLKNMNLVKNQVDYLVEREISDECFQSTITTLNQVAVEVIVLVEFQTQKSEETRNETINAI